MANMKWSIPDVMANTKWSIQGSGRRCKPRASNGAMTAARNSQVFLRSGLFNGIQRQALAVQAFRAPVPDCRGFLIAWWRRRQKIVFEPFLAALVTIQHTVRYTEMARDPRPASAAL
jgi:hypothetical protein